MRQNDTRAHARCLVTLCVAVHLPSDLLLSSLCCLISDHLLVVEDTLCARSDGVDVCVLWKAAAVIQLLLQRCPSDKVFGRILVDNQS